MPGHRPGDEVRLEVPPALAAHGLEERRSCVVVHQVDVALAVRMRTPGGPLLAASHLARDGRLRILWQIR